MNIQDMLIEVFDTKLEKYNMFANWTIRELSTWTRDELLKLQATAIYFRQDDKALASTLQQRITTVLYKKYRPSKVKKLIVRKSKGRRDEIRQKENWQSC